MRAGLMSGGSGSQRAQAGGRLGLVGRRRRPGSGWRPIVPVAYGWGRIYGCPAGPKFSSSATRPRAMRGVACRRRALRRLRSRGAATQPEASGAPSPGRRAPPPFHSRHYGSLATIGRQAAVADFGGVRVRGAPAWWLWGTAHIAFLIGMRNRFTVLATWLWAYLTFRGSSRLITGGGV